MTIHVQLYPQTPTCTRCHRPFIWDEVNQVHWHSCQQLNNNPASPTDLSSFWIKRTFTGTVDEF